MSLITLKFTFIGDSGTGKSTLNHKFITGKFKSDADATIGAFMSCKHVNIGEQRVQVNFWDTAGQERFRSIVPIYYRQASAIILVFDLTSTSSYENTIGYWTQEINRHLPLSVYLIGNKRDLLNQHQINRVSTQARQFAKTQGFHYLELSAKTDQLDNILINMVEEVLAKIPEDERQICNHGIQVDSHYLAQRKPTRCC
jgi:small GTP-binding protein